jgi:DNA-cytosine methyltransferase
MKVLSLFDGISAGRVALERAGIPVSKYYAAEIDKYAIQVTQKNHPATIQLGDINKWQEWNLGEIDLIIGGSPCQGFSFAGKQLNFDDPRSALFFKYVEVLKHYKPKYFLLENVVMKREYQDVISEALGVKPIMINSALVSAQNRKRLYWTNIEDITQPDDLGIHVKDILEDGWVDRDKAHCIDANYWKGGNLKSYFEKHRRQLVFDEPPYIATILGRRVNERGVRDDYNKDIKAQQYVEQRHTGKSNCLTTVQKDNVVIYEPLAQRTPVKDVKFRKLTPIECEKLQTYPDNYTAGVSNTQRYKALGNSWTVDVIAHIFKGIR